MALVVSPYGCDDNLGPRPPDHSLDRINNDGNYEPGNLRWASRKQQQRNMRSNKLTESDAAAIRHPMTSSATQQNVADHFGVTPKTIRLVRNHERRANDSDTKK